MSEPVTPPQRGQKITELQLSTGSEVPTQIMAEWMELASRILERLQVASGSGSPEGVLTATIDKFYRDTAGAPGSNLYIKTTDGGNTGWVLV